MMGYSHYSHLTSAVAKSICLKVNYFLFLGGLEVKQVSDNDGCVINNLFFLHPPRIGLLHEAIHRLRGTRSRE